MLKLSFCLSVLFMLNWGDPPVVENHQEWNQLKEAAHQMGFCVFHINAPFCKAHQGEYAKREASTNLEEEEVYYFEMTKEWATQRIAGRAKIEEKQEKDYLILFDVQQGPFVYKDNSMVKSSMRGFLILDLESSFLFPTWPSTGGKPQGILQTNSKSGILQNTHWREFMSNRLGRYLDQVEISKMDRDTSAAFDDFSKAFYAFQLYDNK